MQDIERCESYQVKTNTLRIIDVSVWHFWFYLWKQTNKIKNNLRMTIVNILHNPIQNGIITWSHNFCF